jgi:D-arabinitol dehydrogenase (NADP+)
VNCFDRAVLAIRTGAVKDNGIVKHRFGLARYADALEAVADSSCVKAVVVPSTGAP